MARGTRLFLSVAGAFCILAVCRGEDRPGPGSGETEQPSFEAYMERSFYTHEPDVRVCVRMRARERLPTDQTGVEAVVRGPSGAVLALGRVPFSEAVVLVPLSLNRVPEGVHAVEVSLSDSGRKMPGSVTVSLVKARPAPKGANELKVDRYNRRLLLNGQPFFPIGATGMRSRDCTMDRTLREVLDRQYRFCREAGFNIIADSRGTDAMSDVNDCRQEYDLAHFYGLKVFAAPSPGKAARPAKTGVKELEESYLSMTRGHPAVIGYHVPGERSAPAEAAGDLKETAKRIRRLAPCQPALASLYTEDAGDFRAGTAGELLGFFTEWTPGSGPMAVRVLSDELLRADRAARELNLPTLHILQLGTGTSCRTLPSPAEQKAAAYLALIHGARGLLYRSLPFEHTSILETQAEISREALGLAPCLLAPDIPQEVTFGPEAASFVGRASRETFSLVQTALKANPAGGQVLLAVNTSDRPVSVEFAVSSLTAGSKVRRVFGTAALEVRDGRFSETIEPLGTRAYFLTGTRSENNAAVRIHLAVSGPEVDAGKKDGQGKQIEGKGAHPSRNRIINPGFESARLAGAPDGWSGPLWGYLLPDIRASGQETARSFEGTYCYRLLPPPSPRWVTASGEEPAVLCGPVPVRDGKVHTLSVYLRSDQPDTLAALSLWPPAQVVRVGTGWKRYTVTRTIPSGQELLTKVGVYHRGGGTLYVDAVQLEEGDKPTAYESQGR